MIIIGLGSNIDGPWGNPEETVKRALQRLDEDPVALVRASQLRRTRPFGVKEQPDFVNAAAIVRTELSPEHLMRLLHEIELEADRRRTLRWGPRTLDLDLLDYDGVVLEGEGRSKGHQKPLILPHPGIAEREFVLEPIAEIAPDWHHPVRAKTARELLALLQSTGGEHDAE